MRNWMSMARGAVANATLVLPMALLSPAPIHKTITSFSLTKTSSYLISFRTPSRRFLSASSLPSFSADHNLSDFGDSHGVAISTKGSKLLLKGMTYPELEKWVQSHGYRPGQAMMLWKRMYGNNIWAHHIDELEGLNKDFKKMLSENAEFKALAMKEIHAASDGTKKILFTLDDGLVIETVVIPCDRGRTTVCVSSQVGCAMNCQFCYTGRMGLKRHLTAAEIVEQAVFARRLFTSEVGSITSVVFMGMGEPLHNIDNVIKAADIMVDEQGLHFSPRKVTVSTSGLVPQLRRFLHESNCALAVSLNATTDEDKFEQKKYEISSQNSTFAPGEDEANSQPTIDMPSDMDIWVDTVGKKKGRIFGLGSISKTLIPSSSKTTNNLEEVDALRSLVPALNESLQRQEEEKVQMRKELNETKRQVTTLMEHLGYAGSSSHPPSSPQNDSESEDGGDSDHLD